MSHPNITVKQGQFVCQDCSKVLRGFDAFFNYCNTCQANHLVEPEPEAGYCKLHPGCGCQKPSECTEERA
jgi:Zn finger protein HypA/HybF involved in hydrogenase expression